ncbi:urease accessory protein UreD [Nitrincola alkalilacustris]|uniref:urease accessory protein UreD n=1 Tax=Nitrincola alkalilacustris TaxID=1571224 RepID=UPI00124D0FBA|nr:urease accessory protein UreD [Nitrincola alkalilacustris]
MNVAVTRKGWEAELEMVFSSRHGATRLSKRSRRGPLALQRPFYPEGEVCHTYLLHPPGGLVGGDQLQINLRVEQGAHALLTTPGATKFYRSDGRLAQQRQHLVVDQDGALEWFPHENIYFPGAIAQLDTRLELAASSRFIGWELQCLGRPVIDEVFTSGEVRAGLTLMLEGKPVLIEQLVTEGDQLIRSASGLRQHPMSGTMIIYAPDLPDIEPIRELLAESHQVVSAATCVDGVLVVRLLGNRTESMQRIMISIWQMIRPQVFGRPACLPRIWST